MKNNHVVQNDAQFAAHRKLKCEAARRARNGIKLSLDDVNARIANCERPAGRRDPVHVARLPNLLDQRAKLLLRLGEADAKIESEYGDLLSDAPTSRKDPRDEIIDNLQRQNAELREMLDKRQRGEA